MIDFKKWKTGREAVDKAFEEIVETFGLYDEDPEMLGGLQTHLHDAFNAGANQEIGKAKERLDEAYGVYEYCEGQSNTNHNPVHQEVYGEIANMLSDSLDYEPSQPEIGFKEVPLITVTLNAEHLQVSCFGFTFSSVHLPFGMEWAINNVTNQVRRHIDRKVREGIIALKSER